jgi:hypothetical protein
MKKLLLLLSVCLLMRVRPAPGQATSGRIAYEGMAKIEPGARRIVINGEEVKPGSPEYPADLPDTRSFELTFSYANPFGKEERDNGGAVIMRRELGPGGTGAPDAGPVQTTRVTPPLEEQVFLDLAGQKTITILTVKTGETAKTYRAEAPVRRTSGWTETGQTRKISGLTCKKATVPHRGETYTVYYTTDLPLTYSPLRELTPERGVVLQIESGREAYKATKVSAPAVAEKDVQPAANAQPVSAEQLADLRQKALADFHQRMFSGTERN